MSEEITILIVDDHPIVRDGLVAILGTQSDFRVAGAAASGKEALVLFTEVRPDVVLLDLEMAGMDGITVMRGLREMRPGVRVVVFTAFDTDERILSAVWGYESGSFTRTVRSRFPAYRPAPPLR